MSIETKSKGVGVFKYILIFEVLALIGLLIAALVMMFTNFDNIDRLMIGVYMMYGVAGFVPVIIMPTLVIMYILYSSKYESIANWSLCSRIQTLWS